MKRLNTNNGITICIIKYTENADIENIINRVYKLFSSDHCEVIIIDLEAKQIVRHENSEILEYSLAENSAALSAKGLCLKTL